MADPLQELRELVEKDYEVRLEIRDALKQAELNRESLEHIRERLEWLEKIANAVYLVVCGLQEAENALLEVLGKRLRKDSNQLDLVRQQLEKRALENGLHDLLEIKAGGDVQVDQSRRTVDDKKGQG